MNPQPKKYKPFGWPFWLLLIGTILILYSFAPKTMCSPRNPTRTQAISNAKQIGLALFQFQEIFGTNPSTATAAEVTAAYPSHGYDLTGNSSNAIFRQLFAAKVITNEEIFYAKTKKNQRPDGNIAIGEALKKGEVSFAYISGLSRNNNPSQPVVLAPVISGTTKFDPKPFDGRAIVLRIDNSVGAYKINKDGHVYDKDGGILSPNHPVWGAKKPTIHYPE